MATSTWGDLAPNVRICRLRRGFRLFTTPFRSFHVTYSSVIYDLVFTAIGNYYELGMELNLMSMERTRKWAVSTDLLPCGVTGCGASNPGTKAGHTTGILTSNTTAH